VYVKTNADELI